MSTKVLNKLVNICTTLSGGEVSSGGTSNDSSCNALSSSEIIDLIYPVGSIYTVYGSTSKPSELIGGTWVIYDSTGSDAELTTGETLKVYRWIRTA